MIEKRLNDIKQRNITIHVQIEVFKENEENKKEKIEVLTVTCVDRWENTIKLVNIFHLGRELVEILIINREVKFVFGQKSTLAE